MVNPLSSDENEGRFSGRNAVTRGRARVPTGPADAKDYGFEWERVQFSIKLAISMTINKAQGQTLDKAAVWLEHPCFGHGQLYVAISRVGDPDNIRLYIGKKKDFLNLQRGMSSIAN